MTADVNWGLPENKTLLEVLKGRISILLSDMVVRDQAKAFLLDRIRPHGNLPQFCTTDPVAAMKMVDDAEEQFGAPEKPEEAQTATATGLDEHGVIVSSVPEKPEDDGLCEDEGCPHHGTPHVCISTPLTEEQIKAIQSDGDRHFNLDGPRVLVPWNPSSPRIDYQFRVSEWLEACFGQQVARDPIERNHRFLEEALELVQSTGCTQAEAHQLVDYVFGRPTGEKFQEAGGVMVCLAALCSEHEHGRRRGNRDRPHLGQNGPDPAEARRQAAVQPAAGRHAMIRALFHALTAAIGAGPIFSLGLAAGKTAGLVDVTWWQVAAPYLCVAAGLGTVVLIAAVIAIVLDIEMAPL